MAGWNRPDEAPKVATRRPSPVRGVVAGALVFALSVCAYFVFLSDADEKPERVEKGAGVIKEAKPAKATKKDGQKDASRVSQKELAVKNEGPVEKGANDTGLSDLPVPGEMPTPPPHKESFDNPSDQLISMTINGNGGPIAPLPFSDNMDEAFRKSLEKPIVINDDDSEEVKAAKRRVLEAREDIKALLKEGKSVRQILEEHREDVNFKAEIRSKIAKEARDILESGDAEGAKKYVMMMNFALQQKGIEEVEMPLTREQRREQLMQRALERKAQKEMNK